MVTKNPTKMRAAFNRPPQPTVSEQNSSLSRLENRFAVASQIAESLPAEEGSPHPDGGATALSLVASADVAPTLPALPALPDGLSEPYRAWCIENRYTPGHVIEIKLSALKDSPFNPRHFYIPKLLEPLIANLAEQKQQQAIHVIPDYANPGTFFINDGGRRVRSMRLLKAEEIKAVVVDLTLGIASYKLGYDLNTQRNTQTVFDNAVTWRRMLDEGMFANQKVLAETLGVDESTVTMTLSVARLPEEVMSEMVQSPDQFGPRMAYEIGRFHSAKGRDKTLRLIHRIVEEGIGVRQVKGLITAPDSETADTPARPARARYQQRIDITLADGTTAGHLKTYGNDRLDLQLVGLPQATRDKIQRQIEEILRPLQKDAAGGPKADADEQS